MTPSKHDQAVIAFESMFGMSQLITKQQAARLFSRTPLTIDRKFKGQFLQTSFGPRLTKAVVVAAMGSEL
jgi:hypothetical protein